MGENDSQGRGFREVDIAITSAQTGFERFSREDVDLHLPASWRNNLTALSQHANLYFVAVQDQIYVYQPEYPLQKLRKHIFAWRVADSGVQRRGAISPDHPHWINRLVVGDFGTEEVIATAHDQGDFVVCTIRSVCRAIEVSRTTNAEQQVAADKHVQYLCRRNVQQSAWGIAIHQHARLLAVSSNTRKITVIAPALVRHSDDDWSPRNIDTRTEDKTFLLSGHDANIPSITFCNTDDDRDGRFLVSTDINGGIIIWDIWKQCGLKKIVMSMGPNDERLRGEHFLGWSVMCLDPRSFRSVSSDLEFVGFHRQSHKKPTKTVDVSAALKHLRDFQVWHEGDPRYTRNRTPRSMRNDPTDVSEDESVYDDSEYSEDEESTGEELQTEDEEYFDPNDLFEQLDDWDESQDSEAIEELYDTIDFGPAPSGESDGLRRAENAGHAVRSLSISNTSPTDSPNIRHPPFAPNGRAHTKLPLPAASKSSTSAFPFLILHSGQRIITLLRPPFKYVAIVCIDPFHEHLPASVFNLSTFERLNLSAYIPDLGVAILATQKGRAAIFTLTALPSAVASNVIPNILPPPSFRRSKNVRRGSSSAGSASDSSGFVPSPRVSADSNAIARCGLRLDWVVPFKSQENAAQRPWSPLLGIATAPVQGYQARRGAVPHRSEGDGDILNRFGGAMGLNSPSGNWSASETHRFRLFLTYADQTVLTYDLFRENGSGQLTLF